MAAPFKPRLVAAVRVCDGCKSRPAVRTFVLVVDGDEKHAEVCEDCWKVLVHQPVPDRN